MSDSIRHTRVMGVHAVSTTGIYCRPGCGARPSPGNVAPLQSWVVAEAAGYRSCLRCRPDREPAATTGVVDGAEGLASSGAPKPIADALALINSGFLDRHSEGNLARRVGYSTRQLNRLFQQHVGASPNFVGRSRRAHFARRLLDETDLSMGQIGVAAGFGSVRQMNRVITEIFGFSPQELRSKRRKGDVLAADGGLRLRLPYSTALDGERVARHLESRATSGVELVDAATYRRTSETCGNPGVIEVSLDTNHPADLKHLEIRAHLPTFDSIIDDVARVRAMFGLDDPVEVAESHLRKDPMLSQMIQDQTGLRVIGGWDRFEVAVRVVVGQQVTVGAATTVASRLASSYGKPVPEVLGVSRIFPTPERLIEIDKATAGMPGARTDTVQNLALAVLEGDVDLYGTADSEQFREQLLSVKGIGPWTADMIEMRAARNPDVFPAGDLGIRRAVSQLVEDSRAAGTKVTRPPKGSDMLSAEQVAEVAEPWRPYRSVAAQHLWATLAA